MVNMKTTEEDTSDHTANVATIQTLCNEIAELKQIITGLTNTTVRRKKEPRKYCWTHGWCTHSSQECQAKAVGNQN